MKNILKLSIAAVASSILFGGCIKETFPTDGVGDQEVTTESLMNGLYYQMTAINSTGSLAAVGFQWDFGLPSVHLALDAMCEDMAIAGNPGYDWFNAHACNQYMGDSYYQCVITWYNYYPWIKTCNDVLKRIDPETATEHELAMRGQALAYRAAFYLDLTRMYEFKENKYTDGEKVLGLGVPIITEETTEEMNKNNPRATLEKCYEFILDNLKEAETVLDGYKRSSKVEADMSVVYGLYARTYLSMSDRDEQYFALAADYARKAINASGCTPLTQTEWEDPSTGFNSMSASSWMWSLIIPSENVSNLINFTAHIATENSWGYAPELGRAISVRLYNQISNQDFRKHSWVDPQGMKFYEYKSIRGTQFIDALARQYPYTNIKFRPAQGNFTNYKIGGAADHPLMRVEEMYLIEAEAAGHANLTTGIRLLNEFMAYRVLDGSYNCTSKVNDFRSLQEEVALQKRIEFWGEGIVYYDYKRLRLGCTRGYSGTNFSGDYLLNADEIAPWWNWVIPRSETQSNAGVNGYNNPDPMGTVEPWEE